ncbi:MAG: hypothetical protein HYW03_23000, partial [Deltaproteobacteria bacterium]|nr:hypothetical protein [Deltaproteobacteria bacterium]
FALTVNKSGAGTGTVTGTGINCGTDCSEPFANGTSVVLTAAAASGSTFAGWSGGGCTGTASTCTVTMSAATTVTATFNLASGFAPDKIGVYRPSTGEWFFDLNGNGVLETCGIDYCVSSFGSLGVPVVGDWNGSGVSQLGMFLTDAGQWQLDQNANETWEGCLIDTCIGPYGQTDIPIPGRWDLQGFDRIGVFRPSTALWYLDVNGNGQWNGCRRDVCGYLSVYKAGDLPIVGHWNGNGLSQLGFFRPSTGEWFLDYNGNRTWDDCTQDRCLSFGIAGQPVSGDWDGTGASKIGVFDPITGGWFLDLNGNGQWDGCEVDGCMSFGLPGDIPVVGKW